MKKWWLLIILIIIFLYFFYPLCGFKTIGTKFPAEDNCNTCTCSIYGAGCTLRGCIDPNYKTSIVLVVTQCNKLCSNYTDAYNKDEVQNEFCSLVREVDLNGNKDIESHENKTCDELVFCSDINCN